MIAEKRRRRDGNVVMAGAHLDSVPAGPGIQDNGSGSAALLEVAQNLRRHRPYNTLRFAWWGAEELGLIGSTAWVANLSDEELDEIALYLNFDMIGSPNYFIGVYDADESSYDAPVVVPDGIDRHRGRLRVVLHARGRPYDDTEFSGRSDYQAFINNGIPASGLFTGAEVLKTAEQATIWGGVIGEQFDQCYHLACDTYANISEEALAVNTRRRRLRRADVRLLDGVGQRGSRTAGARPPRTADPGRARGHLSGRPDRALQALADTGRGPLPVPGTDPAQICGLGQWGLVERQQHRAGAAHVDAADRGVREVRAPGDLDRRRRAPTPPPP